MSWWVLCRYGMGKALAYNECTKASLLAMARSGQGNVAELDEGQDI